MRINVNTKDFMVLPLALEWSFENKSTAETQYLTHSYHRYPAKFIPHLVRKLIARYSKRKSDLIADCFAGCGTTLVEAKLMGRESVGVDVNPIATLITRVKTTPIKPVRLSMAYKRLTALLDLYASDMDVYIPKSERINYWFSQERQHEIAYIINAIEQEKSKKIREFFLCALSHCFKTCSIWLQTSTKPTRNLNKQPAWAIPTFNMHVKRMMAKNESFYKKLEADGNLSVISKIYTRDARRTRIAPGSVKLLITSPPYITSYEYADLHELSGLWFRHFESLQEFRKQFIGTFYTNNDTKAVKGELAQGIVDALYDANKRTGLEIAQYFRDMEQVIQEMQRVLTVGGRTCIVIGNTTRHGVKIKCAEVFTELLMDNHFQVEQIWKRGVGLNSKYLPTIRDVNTGKFTSLDNKNSKQVYPEEYILIGGKLQ
jgi:DNA modification methylase